jgi:hypothetical protein
LMIVELRLPLCLRKVQAYASTSGSIHKFTNSRNRVAPTARYISEAVITVVLRSPSDKRASIAFFHAQAEDESRMPCCTGLTILMPSIAFVARPRDA